MGTHHYDKGLFLTYVITEMYINLRACRNKICRDGNCKDIYSDL